MTHTIKLPDAKKICPFMSGRLVPSGPIQGANQVNLSPLMIQCAESNCQLWSYANDGCSLAGTADLRGIRPTADVVETLALPIHDAVQALKDIHFRLEPARPENSAIISIATSLEKLLKLIKERESNRDGKSKRTGR